MIVQEGHLPSPGGKKKNLLKFGLLLPERKQTFIQII